MEIRFSGFVIFTRERKRLKQKKKFFENMFAYSNRNYFPFELLCMSRHVGILDSKLLLFRNNNFRLWEIAYHTQTGQSRVCESFFLVDMLKFKLHIYQKLS